LNTFHHSLEGDDANDVIRGGGYCE